MPPPICAQIASARSARALRKLELSRGAIEYRLVVYQTKRLPKLASEPVSRGINVLAAPGNTAAA